MLGASCPCYVTKGSKPTLPIRITTYFFLIEGNVNFRALHDRLNRTRDDNFIGTRDVHIDVSHIRMDVHWRAFVQFEPHIHWRFTIILNFHSYLLYYCAYFIFTKLSPKTNYGHKKSMKVIQKPFAPFMSAQWTLAREDVRLRGTCPGKNGWVN